MGKRSRKRAAGEAPAAPAERSERPARTPQSRAERDEARRRRAATRSARPRSRGRPTMDERPPPPWGSFPIVELVVLLAIALFVFGMIVRGDRGAVMLMAALVLGSLAGLELSIREHFAGYRSHTTLLAAVATFAAMALTFVAGGRGDTARALLVIVAPIVFVTTFWGLRQAFKRRSGGLGFR
jgi:hypothetical protein